MQIVKKLLICIVLFANIDLFAQSNFKQCKVDDRIMYAIATVERHPSLPIGYPYIISINFARFQKKAKRIGSISKYFIDKRTLDCKNQKTCIKVLSILKKHSINNLDCGAFQINSKFWKMENKEYFDLRTSYKMACNIIMQHNKTKWTWKNIAKFHSGTKKYNDKYKKIVIAAIMRERKNDR